MENECLKLDTVGASPDKSDHHYYDENGKLDVSRLILSTALKAFHRAFILASLAILLVIGMFPLSSMRFYESIGLKERALYMANIYTNREKKKDASAFSGYADGLYYKMMIAEELYLSTGSERFLTEIYNSTYDYSRIFKIDERNAFVDSSNLHLIAPVAHANVYSFKDRVCNLHYFAALRLGKENEFLRGNALLDITDVENELTYVFAEDLAKDLQKNAAPKTAIDFSIFFGQFSEYIKYNLSMIADNSGEVDESTVFNSSSLQRERFIAVMNLLEEKVEFFEEFALKLRDNLDSFAWTSESFVWQTQLYLVRTLGKLYDQVQAAAEFLSYREEQWEQLSRIDKDNSEVTLSEYYYYELLPSYLEFYEGNGF